MADDSEVAFAGPARKRALITGGGGTLAQATADALRQTGRFAEILTPSHSELDVTDGEAIRSFFAQLDRIDLLINNAGLTIDAPAIKLTESDWDTVLDANLRGAFLCSREAIRSMFRQRSGHIVNIGSFSALRPPAGQANYAAAKAGLIGLTQSLAEEVGKRGVRVNCVLPGFLEETGMTRGLPDSVVDQARTAHVLGRFNTPAEAGKFIAFLDEMEAVSAQVFQLDSRIRRW